MASVLVTGANGFIGSHLVERLAAGGHRVRCLVRPSSDLRWIEHVPAERVLGDATRPESLSPALDSIEWVFHAGGITRASDASEFFRVNAEGTRHLAEAAARAGVRRFVYLSSQAAAGPSRSGRPVTESDAPAPVSAYGRSKLAGEEAALASGAPVVILRPAAVYGPRDRDVLLFFRLARRGIGLAVGDPARQLSLIHVSDLVTVLLRAAEETRAIAKTYFVNDGRVHSQRDVLRAVGRAVGRRIVILRVPSALLWATAWVEERRAIRLGTRPILTRERAREYRAGAWVSDAGLARSELGAAPAFEIERGFAETAAWYRENGWL